MMGQANVFYRYFPERIQPAIDHYQGGTRRLLQVLDSRLNNLEYRAGVYSVADIANWAWVRTYRWTGAEIADLPHLTRWVDTSLTGGAEGVTMPPSSIDLRTDDPDSAKQFAEDALKMVKTWPIMIGESGTCRHFNQQLL